jgi:hypothetical protein
MKKQISPLREALKKFYAERLKGKDLEETIDALNKASRSQVRATFRKLIK